MSSKKAGIAHWDVDHLLEETAKGDPKMRYLEMRNFVNTYKRMTNLSTEEKDLLKISRTNGLPFLVDHFYEEHLESLKEAFKACHNRVMTKEKLMKWIYENIGEEKDLIEDFDRIFNLIDIDLDGSVTWTEMISFLETEMIEKNDLLNGYVVPFYDDYIQDSTREIPSKHKRLIVDIIFWPAVKKGRKQEKKVGRYVSVTDNGIVDFFNLNMEHMWQAVAPSPWPIGYRTIVKSMCALPDLDLLCLGCIARDLCFYKCTYNVMQIVYHITNLDSHPVEMVYNFYENPDKKSYIAIGELDGSVDTILFHSDERNPFRLEPGKDFYTTSYKYIRMGCEEKLEVRAFKGLHGSWITRARHLEPLDCLLTTCNSSTTSLALLDVHETAVVVTINVPLGVTCAEILPPPPKFILMPKIGYEEPPFGEASYEKRPFNWWIVTGGLDTRLRVWDLNDTSKPRFTLTGHISSLVLIIVQYDQDINCPVIISYSRLGRINVWNGRTFEKLQLLTAGLTEVPEETPLAICYNEHYQRLLLCTNKILTLKVGRFVDKCISSGNTEREEITSTLYNRTYHAIITVTLGSVITRWDPQTGAKQLVIPRCHFEKNFSGEEVWGISTAAINPAENLLATGATNGSIKLWDIYRGVTFRSFSINGPVRWIFWQEYGLMVVTTDGKVRIFKSSPSYDPASTGFELGTLVSSCMFLAPSFLAVGTINSELILTDFATGLPIKRFNVTNPDKSLTAEVLYPQPEEEVNIVFQRKEYLISGGNGRTQVERTFLLHDRPVAVGVGNLLVSLRTGVVQLWSTHENGGFVTCFRATHETGDSVVVFGTDPEHRYLFTGTVFGFLKTWWMGDFGLGDQPVQEFSADVEFPFLCKELMEFPALVATRNEECCPRLLNCFRAHSGSISTIEYFPGPRIIMTSAIKSVSYWTLAGQFINTLGCSLKWLHCNFDEPMKEVEVRMPSDLKRILSSHSLKILNKDFGREEKKPEERRQKGRHKQSSQDKALLEKMNWKRADLSSFWKGLEEVQQTVTRVPPLPDLAQEQLYQNMAFFKTEKVTWIKPPKIIRSKRKRLELYLLHKDRNKCRECGVGRKEGERQKHFQPNKGATLQESVRLVDEAQEKHGTTKRHGCGWRVCEREQLPPIDRLFDTELLGEGPAEIAENFGTLAMGAAEQPFAEARLFGQPIPSDPNHLEDFIKQAMKAKGIHDTPKNRRYISNLIKLEKKNAILRDLESFRITDEHDLVKFDCFSQKEKKEVLKKVRDAIDNMNPTLGLKPDKNGTVSGVYSLIANCLYDTKYRDLSDNELLSLLVDLSKRLNGDRSSGSSVVGYKKRFEWWDKVTGADQKEKEKFSINFPKINAQIRFFIANLIQEGGNLSSLSTSDFFDAVTKQLVRAIERETCSKCGSKYKRNDNDLTTQNIEELQNVETHKTFNLILKSCLAKASVGEIREEDAINELCKFVNDIVVKCLPCKTCKSKNYLSPRYSEEKEKRILKKAEQVIAFCRPREHQYQKNLEVDYKRAVLYTKRKKAIERMEKESIFQKEKEINIAKYEKRLEKLRSAAADMISLHECAKEKQLDVKNEIKATIAKIRAEYARQKDT